MFDIGVKHGWPLSHKPFGLYVLYIDELETFLEKIDGESLCLYNTMSIIHLYVDDGVLLSRSEARLQRVLHKLYEFCTSFSLEVNISKTKIMLFGHNKRKLNQEAFYLSKEQIEITHEYKYLGNDFYSHGYRTLGAALATRGRIIN